MNYRVRYRREADEQLTEIWLKAADRDAVTRASDHIEQMLQHDPLSRGESRGGNERLWIVRPLTVVYEVFSEDYKVIVKMFRLARLRH